LVRHSVSSYNSVRLPTKAVSVWYRCLPHRSNVVHDETLVNTQSYLGDWVS